MLDRLRLGFLLLVVLTVGAGASIPMSWGTYGDDTAKGYLHGWGDEWMDFSADSLAIQHGPNPGQRWTVDLAVVDSGTLGLSGTSLDSQAAATAAMSAYDYALGRANEARALFGAQENAPGGRLVRTIGIVRAKIKIGLQNLAYNIRRLVILERAAAA